MKKFLLVVLSLMTIGFSSTFADAKYLGGWDFGIQDTLHIVPSPNLNNDHIKFSCFQNVLDVSTNYQGIVPIGNNVSFTFLFGGMFSYVSNEYCKGVSIKDGWYFNDNPKRVYHKGDIVYDLIFENSDLGLGLDLGLGFDIRNSDKFAFGIIYKPLIWRNWFSYYSYPLYYDIKTYFDFGKILDNERTAFRLEIGWEGLYGISWDFVGGFTIGCKCILLGDSKSIRNKSAAIINSIAFALPIIEQAVKYSSSSDSSPSSIPCVECDSESRYGIYKYYMSKTKFIDGTKYYKYECNYGHSGWYAF